MNPSTDDATIADLAAAFRAGAVDPIAATEACLEAIAERDDALNAMTTVAGERALEAAAHARRELRSGIDRGPLHGVPIVVKDLVDVAGLPTGYGSAPVFRTLPARNAALVDRLEVAGAVLLGKANLLEFAYGVAHPNVGPTRNPWDPTRTAGGSSGGSAAAVATGMAYASLGTDTGGSIRIPAAYCGVVGLKPTYGALPLAGVFPLSRTLDHAGPLARTSACALATLDALTRGAGATTPLPLNGRRFGVVRAHVDDPCIAEDVRAAFDDACGRLVDGGASLVDVHLAEVDGIARSLFDIVLAEAAVVHARGLREHRDAYAPGTRAQLEAGLEARATAYLRARAHRRRLTDAAEEAVRGLDALIAPTVPWVAPKEDPSVHEQAGHAEVHCTGLANLTGQPSVSLVSGPGAAGLPTGLMLTGPRGGDRRLLRVAMGVEAVLPPATPPRAGRNRRS